MQHVLSWVCFLSTFTNAFGEPRAVGPVVARIETGKVRGDQYEILENKYVNAYYGVPYAKAPVGPLRFNPPRPMDPWIGELGATKQPNSCIQPNQDLLDPLLKGAFVTDEDCLYVNIWTSVTDKSDNADGLPVIVIIHSGGFTSGSISQHVYDGMNLAALGNAVVVTMNYRLGALGFMSLGINNAPGNMGLMDQQMALKWIHRNIARFGGNPAHVLLFGESSGAVSVSYHLLSPGSVGLFTRAFVQSGSILSQFSFQTKSAALHHASILANATGCSSRDPQLVLDCMIKLPVEKLSVGPEFPVRFGPTVDGLFIAEPPAMLLSEGRIANKVPLWTGVTLDEGSVLVASGLLPCSRDVIHGNITTRLMFFCFKAYMQILPDNAVQTLVDHYVNARSGQDDVIRRSISDLVSDVVFVCPSRDFQHLYSSHGAPTFSYVFSYSSDSAQSATWMGVTHGSDFNLIMADYMAHKLNVSKEDENMADKMINMVAVFAKTGQIPTDASTIWPPYSKNDPQQVKIGLLSDTLIKDFHGANCDLIQKLLLSLRSPVQRPIS